MKAARRARSRRRVDGLADFLRHISVAREDALSLLDMARDADLPLRIRLAAQGAIADAPDEFGLSMARSEDSDWKVKSAAWKFSLGARSRRNPNIRVSTP